MGSVSEAHIQARPRVTAQAVKQHRKLADASFIRSVTGDIPKLLFKFLPVTTGLQISPKALATSACDSQVKSVSPGSVAGSAVGAAPNRLCVLVTRRQGAFPFRSMLWLMF